MHMAQAVRLRLLQRRCGLERVERSRQDAFAILDQVETVGGKEPVREQAAEGGMRRQTGQADIERGRKLAACHRIEQDLLQPQQAVHMALALANQDGVMRVGEFAFVEDDVEDAPAALIGGGQGQHIDAAAQELAQRVFHLRAGVFFQHRFHGQAHAFTHGVEQVALVLEMPVDGPARDLSGLGHIGQRGLRDAALMEHLLGRIEDAGTRFQRFFLGRTGHVSTLPGKWPWRRPSGAPRGGRVADAHHPQPAEFRQKLHESIHGHEEVSECRAQYQGVRFVIPAARPVTRGHGRAQVQTSGNGMRVAFEPKCKESLIFCYAVSNKFDKLMGWGLFCIATICDPAHPSPPPPDDRHSIIVVTGSTEFVSSPPLAASTLLSCEISMSSVSRFTRLTMTVAVAAALVACGQKPAAQGGQMPPAEVSVVTIAPQRVAITNELPGRVEAFRVAQVRARVAGIVQKRVFKEGSEVKEGQVLFKIDPAQYKASLESAQATLARAQANLTQTSLTAQRYKPLVEVNAVSKQEYDNAVAAQKQAEADVAAGKAAVQTANLNLGYATVTSPISGRIGRALVTEGALVGQGDATQLALVQQLDPVYVNVTQSSADLLKLQQAMAAGQLKSVGDNKASVTLVLENGQAYEQPGKLLFSDISVDESTGSVSLRAEFPNPKRLLLPGTYVRTKIEQAVDEQALLVPQQAVVRDAGGSSVMVVNAESKVEARPVKTGGARGNNWQVIDGLKEGDRVIVEGLQKVRPGAAVKPVQWNPAGAPAQAAGQPAKQDASAQQKAN
ncbi:hypothetical protein Lal_00007103 [Lupinus albus]|nr:hypothetical protein Lal_00007103 [Lupinus albus]